MSDRIGPTNVDFVDRGRAGWSQSTLLVVALVGLSTVVGAALRWHEIDASLWLDEALTHEGASQSIFVAIAHRLYPLYYVLANLALRFDDTETALRFPSFVAGVLTIPAIYVLGSLAGGRYVGLVSALLLSFNVYHIRYSQEARFYALVMLGSVIMTWMLYRALTRGGKRYWAGFVVAAFLSLLSQVSVAPFFASLVAGAGGWIVAHGSKGTKRVVFRKLVVLGLAALAASPGPLIMTFVNGTMINEYLALDRDGGESNADAEDASPVFQLTVPQYARYILDFTPSEPEAMRYGYAILAIAGMVVLCTRQRCFAVLIGSQFILAPIPYLLIHTSHWFASRYFCSLTPLYLILIGVGIVAWAKFCQRTLRRVRRGSVQDEPATPTPKDSMTRGGIVVLALTLLTLAPFQTLAIARYYDRRPTTDWKGLAAFLAQHIQPKDTVVLLTPELRDAQQPIGVFLVPLDYYLLSSLARTYPDHRYAVMGSLRFTGVDSVEDLRALTHGKTSPRVWFIMRNERTLPNGYAGVLHRAGISEETRFGKIMVRCRPESIPEVSAKR